MSYITKKLKNGTEVKLAQNLVYSVFVEEMKWVVAKNNPSGIRYINCQESKLFVDDFEDVAIWFGTFHHKKLIACWRFCSPLMGSYELELYHSLPSFLKNSRSLEITRLVILPEYRFNCKAILHLYCQSYLNLYKDYDYAFGAPSFPHPGNIYLKLGGKKIDNLKFKYNKSDKNLVWLTYFTFKEKTITSKIMRLAKIINI